MSVRNSGAPPIRKPRCSTPPCRQSLTIRRICSIIAAPGDRVAELIEVNHLVEGNQQAAVAGEHYEASQQLEIVVDVGVIDDDPHAEVGSGIRLVVYSPRSQRTAAAVSAASPPSCPRQ